MTLDWRESDGPAVMPATHHGFGTRLLCQALKQFGGTIHSKFEPTGLICEMNLLLSCEPEATSPAIDLPSAQSGSAPALE